MVLIVASRSSCLTRASRVAVGAPEPAQHDRLQGGGQVFGQRDARAEHHVEGERCPAAWWVLASAPTSGFRLVVLDQGRNQETGLAWPGLAWTGLDWSGLAWHCFSSNQPNSPRFTHISEQLAF